jgi:3-oxoacyl-[acyl-carrier-protein] synthase II
MKMALKHAGIKPSQVDYVNAHATGTAIGDVAEALAIQSLMVGSEGYSRDSDVTVSSTKGSIGHLLGAAGAVEAVFSVLSIADVSYAFPACLDTITNAIFRMWCLPR